MWSSAPLWQIAARNLQRSPRRAWATGASVAIGLAGVVLVFGFVHHLERWLRVAHVYSRHSGHVSIYKHDGLQKFLVHPATFAFTHDEQRRITTVLAADQTVERFGFHLLGAGLISNGCRTMPFKAIGTAPALERWIRERPEARQVTPTLAQFVRGHGDWEQSRVDLPIGVTEWLARQLGKTHTYDEIPAGAPLPVGVPDCAVARSHDQLARDANVQLLSSTHAGSFAVADAEIVNWFTTGLAESESEALSAPLETLQRFYDTDGIAYVSVFLAPKAAGGDLVTAAGRLAKRLATVGVSVDAYPFNHPDLAPTYVGGMQFLRALGAVTLIVMALLVALTLVNSVTLSVAERARELGTFRAIGFGVPQVVGVQLRETALLMIIAEAGGLLLSLASATLLNSSGLQIRMPGFSGTQSLHIAFAAESSVALLVLFCIAMLAAYGATRRQLRRAPLELLQSP